LCYLDSPDARLRALHDKRCALPRRCPALEIIAAFRRVANAELRCYASIDDRSTRRHRELATLTRRFLAARRHETYLNRATRDRVREQAREKAHR